MSRFMITGALALAMALPAAAPAVAQSGYDEYGSSSAITVTGPRSRTLATRGSAGAPMRVTEVDMVVSTADLDLNTTAGRDMLDMRVADAAAEGCRYLDENYGNPYPTTDETRDCRREAMRSARWQVRDAIVRAGYRQAAAFAYGY